LREAAGSARGATAYVSLEPCAHQGRTPPCAPQLVAAGLARVVVAIRDPDPRVRGRGLFALRQAGVAVDVGECGAQARWLNRRFLTAARGGRPYVLLKAALTLDGRIATASGESKWLTSPAQRRAARGLRRLHDGVLIGIGTALADDPLLLPSPRVRRPFHRIVLDSQLRLPADGRLARSAARQPVWVMCRPGNPGARRRLEAAGVGVLPLKGRGRLAPEQVLEALWAIGLRSLMVEGGSEVLGSFLAGRLVDEVALFRAPLLLGGRRARPAFGGPDLAQLADALRLRTSSPPPGAFPELPAGLGELWKL
jgi:diaminohydroxyphosphoribosylaminopyrimidine deaminase/5-amino-6-(5-phosphoribosylamino)uracil reductase